MHSGEQFEAKSFEAAVDKACSYFGKDREDLEITVIDPGSSGIFGLGGRKCVVQASPRYNKQEELENLVRSTVENLLSYMVQPSEITVQVDTDRVVVGIKEENNPGLLIGREGQTISSLEYLVNRMVAKQWPEKVHVQLDTGGYKTRQEEQIKKTALDLARKVKSSGKPMSTKPLSSYHRRLVHLCLQQDEQVVTHSKGDGLKKRVNIRPRKDSRKQKEAKE